MSVTKLGLFVVVAACAFHASTETHKDGGPADADSDAAELVSDASVDGSTETMPTRRMWVVFGPNAIHRDLAGLFGCLLGRTDFNTRASAYQHGFAISWGAEISGACGDDQYGCAVDALRAAGFAPTDHDVVEIVTHGYCGGDNNARGDGAIASGVRVIGANVGDCPSFPQAEERVAVHEAFESCGHWENADCCTGEVNTSCADQGNSLCPDCPCSCGQFTSDGSYGGYTLDCGDGHVYWSQRTPTSPAGELDPNTCRAFTSQL
jgi:hypothetical protein